MPEIQSSESQETDRLSSILAGYLTPKELAQRSGLQSELSRAGIIFDRARHVSKSAERFTTAGNL